MLWWLRNGSWRHGRGCFLHLFITLNHGSVWKIIRRNYGTASFSHGRHFKLLLWGLLWLLTLLHCSRYSGISGCCSRGHFAWRLVSWWYSSWLLLLWYYSRRLVTILLFLGCRCNFDCIRTCCYCCKHWSRGCLSDLYLWSSLLGGTTFLSNRTSTYD